MRFSPIDDPQGRATWPCGGSLPSHTTLPPVRTSSRREQNAAFRLIGTRWLNASSIARTGLVGRVSSRKNHRNKSSVSEPQNPPSSMN
jgi:hypothetical protein